MWSNFFWTIFFVCLASTEESTDLKEYHQSTRQDTSDSDEHDFDGLPVQGLVDGFLRLAKETRANGLPSPLDLVFAVDGSQDMSPHNFYLQKQLVSSLARQFSLSPSGTRVAVVSYGSLPSLEFDFHQHVNRECITKAIYGVKLNRGQPFPGQALDLIKDKVFTKDAGARARARKAVFLIVTRTPVNMGPRLFPAAWELKRRGVEVFVLVVHRYIETMAVGAIASQPYGRHLFHIKEFRSLKQLSEAVKFKGFVRKCSGQESVYDECHRRCACRDGELVNCHRIRKEFTSMSLCERRRFIRALITVSSSYPYRKEYDKLTRFHPKFFYKIHILKYFFPWHRWYILTFENILRKLDCRVTVPYWDWAEAASNQRQCSGQHIRDFWYPDSHGFGGNGRPPGHCVVDGPFRAGKWYLPSWLRYSCLKRAFNHTEMSNLQDSKFVRRMIVLPLHQFKRFESLVREHMHNTFHNAVGGTMSLEQSASAPEFWSHHAFMDKLWSDWQDRGAAFKFLYYRKVHSRLPGSARFGWEFMNLQRQPLCVSVLYERPSLTNDDEGECRYFY